MEEASWEPAENLSNCAELLQGYWATHGEGVSLPQPVPELAERSRGNTLARENIVADSDLAETLSTRGRKRKRREATALRRSTRLHPE